MIEYGMAIERDANNMIVFGKECYLNEHCIFNVDVSTNPWNIEKRGNLDGTRMYYIPMRYEGCVILMNMLQSQIIAYNYTTNQVNRII